MDDGRGVESRVLAWSTNHLLFHEAALALVALHDAGIRTLILKGAALALSCYDDAGLRPMHDVDVLVPEPHAARAMSVLVAAGWEAEYRPPHAMLPFQHAVGFRNATGGRIDLHWRVLADGRQDIAEDWWPASRPLLLSGVATRMLAPADQLLHVCVHGARSRHTQPRRWTGDVLAILKTWPDLDWTALVACARTRRLTLPLADTLDDARATSGAPIPIEVIAALRAAPVTPGERRLYRLRSGSSRSLRAIARAIEWRRRWRLSSGPRGRQLLTYLRSRFGAPR